MDSQLVATQEEIFREHSREPGVSPRCVWTRQAGSADGILLLVVASSQTYKNVSPQQKRGTSSGDDIVFGGHYQQGAVRASARAGRETGMCFTASSSLALRPEVGQDSQNTGLWWQQATKRHWQSGSHSRSNSRQ